MHGNEKSVTDFIVRIQEHAAVTAKKLTIVPVLSHLPACHLLQGTATANAMKGIWLVISLFDTYPRGICESRSFGNHS